MWHYVSEKAFVFLEDKGGKDFYNFQALESAAEALYDVIGSLKATFPSVVEKLNPDGATDENDGCGLRHVHRSALPRDASLLSLLRLAAPARPRGSTCGRTGFGRCFCSRPVSSDRRNYGLRTPKLSRYGG